VVARVAAGARSRTRRWPRWSIHSSSSTWITGKAACEERVVRRQRVHRGRHPDELPARSRARAGWSRAIARRWRSSSASTRVPPIKAPWKRAGRTSWRG